MMHKANKDSSQMAVHSSSQSQMIIHESNNIHRLLPSNPIIHQDQFSTLYVPMPVSKNENVQYEDFSLNRPQNTQSTSQQPIRIKQEPESDNESDINNDITEEYGHYDPFIVRVVPDYSEEMEENVQYEDFSLNRPQNTQSTSQQPIRIKQEPESDNESDINNDITEEYGHYDPFIVRVVPDYSEEMEENVQYEDFSLNRPQNTQSTSQQPIRIKQEPESDNESDINNDITEEYGHYDPFIVRVVPDYSEEMEENVQYEDCSLNRPQNTKSTSQQTISIKQEPESDNESDINNDITEEYGHYDPFIVRVVPDYSEEMEENVQYEDFSLNRPQNTQSTSQQPIRIKQEPESDNEPDTNTRSIHESYDYGRFIGDKIQAFSEKTKEAVQFELFKIICRAHRGYYK
ncbi:Hypothetical protein CINCED_3A012561 [Cinara cedri]|nr:Hypothetical protein CINCED_3A012561 [Cinara cedri]